MPHRTSGGINMLSHSHVRALVALILSFCFAGLTGCGSEVPPVDHGLMAGAEDVCQDALEGGLAQTFLDTGLQLKDLQIRIGAQQYTSMLQDLLEGLEEGSIQASLEIMRPILEGAESMLADLEALIEDIDPINARGRALESCLRGHLQEVLEHGETLAHELRCGPYHRALRPEIRRIHANLCQ